MYLKAQDKGTSSFNKTSLRLPLGQYSVRIHTLGTSTHPPINLHRFWWSIDLK